MKIALVHDYLKDFGGAERVLKVLTEIYPKAPIYTAFRVKNSPAGKIFKDKKIIESPLAPIIRPWKLYSPLRFLLPWIWGKKDLSEYDLVITSTSNYIARGFKTGKNTKVIAYCHTPPRFLYGYDIGFNLQKYWVVRVYAAIIAHFLRMFDFDSAQKIDHWIVNSENVKKRVQKFYRKDSTVIYPPINVAEIIKTSKNTKKEDYFFIASRLVGTKGIDHAIEAAVKLGLKLKIAGGTAGYINHQKHFERLGRGKVEFLGRVSDKELWELYASAKGFIALARDEDFGMTVVEAQAAGTPVIAFNGGGFKESVIDGKTGILISDTNEKTLEKAIKRFESIKWNKKTLQNNAKKFSKERFIKEIKEYIKKVEV